MADRLSPQARSRLMSRVHHRGTSPELLLRKALWSANLRYRLRSSAKLPGSPDILFPKARVAVFVDGCFWHGCSEHGTQSKTRPEFWAAKIARNRERDAENTRQLSRMGWLVLRFWEHSIRGDLAQCVSTIGSAVRKRTSG